MRDFWWGFKDDGQHKLYLAAWKNLCSSKQAGGIGFKRCKDMNVTFMTKLAWEIIKKPNKLWVQIIRSNYLSGRQLLNYRLTQKDASWVWKGIVANIERLKEGCCYKLGSPTMLHIWDDLWIPTIQNFKPPLMYKVENGPIYVQQLISRSNQCWYMEIRSSLFPYSIIREILRIHIPRQLE